MLIFIVIIIIIKLAWADITIFASKLEYLFFLSNLISLNYKILIMLVFKTDTSQLINLYDRLHEWNFTNVRQIAILGLEMIKTRDIFYYPTSDICRKYQDMSDVLTPICKDCY